MRRLRKRRERQFQILFYLLAAAVILVVIWYLVGCHHVDECEPGDTQCFGNEAERCNNRGEWELHLDCSEINWQCCTIDGYSHCFSESTCQAQGSYDLSTCGTNNYMVPRANRSPSLG
jgi:hypothetical protein